MFEAIREFVAASPAMAWSIVSVICALIFISSLWDKVRWWWLNTWMSFPVFGKTASLSKHLDPEKNNSAWFQSERTLCTKYKEFVQPMSKKNFSEKVNYMSYAGDNGRHTMPKLLWFVIVIMVFIEAMGFSYVLAGWTVPGASENLQQTAAYGIAFMISALLVALTHFAGHELYRSGTIQDARKKWQADTKQYPEYSNSNGKHPLGKETVPLNSLQSTDEEQPEYSRRINRIGSSEASYKVTIATSILVVLIAIGATYVRGQVLEQVLNDEVTGQTEQTNTDALTSDGMDMTSNKSDDVKPPPSDLEKAKNATTKEIGATTNIKSNGGWATFIVLAILFVFLQVLGTLFGFKWSFAGQESKAAYKALGSGKFATYDDLKNHYSYISDIAQSKLEELQQRMMKRNSMSGSSGMHLSKSFRDHLKESSEDGGEIPTPLTVDDALKHIASLQTTEERKAHISELPIPLRSEVVAALKEKQEKEKKIAEELEKEIGDLTL